MKIDDSIISNVAVRIRHIETGECIGSGIIYKSQKLGESLYVLTAAHCLFEGTDNFTDPYKEVIIDFYDSETNSYYGIRKEIDHNLISADEDKDVAVIVFEYVELERFSGKIPTILCVRENFTFREFVAKGFPNATQGKELDVIYPTWKQEMTEVFKFQLQLNEDYNSWAVSGFSGSGIFMKADGQLYLLGIFARYRANSVGKVIYCQYLETVNELLEKNYKPLIDFSYVGGFGMTPLFFKQKTEKAIENLFPRFNEDLNFRLPIALKFNDLAKDVVFKARVLKVFDSWLTEKSWKTLPKNDLVGEVETKLQDLRNKVKDWLIAIGFDADVPFDVKWINDEISTFYKFISGKIDEIYKLRSEIEKAEKEKAGKEGKESKEANYLHRAPYHAEHERLWEIVKNNREFLQQLGDDIDIALANAPFLIVEGEAGCGKSHLLGDIATENLKRGIPSILLLGQHFNSTRSISANILEQLDLQCTFKEFLTALNEIGKQINSRVIVLIDAINESKTSEMWRDGLAGFINEVAQYPYIGVALTIRSTYFKSIIPDKVKENKGVTFMTHEGFRGNEYKALKKFCDFYGLKQPSFPILAPEFTNPLFLQLVCIGVQNSLEKSFPMGFNGIKKVFDLYIEAVNTKLLSKTEYAHRKNLVRTAINKIALKCFDQDDRMLNLEEAVELFDNEFEKFPNLLYDLIQENVLIKNMFYDYEKNLEYETVYFAYERFGDYYIADELLMQYSDSEELTAAFTKEGKLVKLINEYHYQGILEAAAVLLPEKFGIEIYEVYDWLIKEEKETVTRLHYREKTNVLSDCFFKSLTWRSIESIDRDKLNIWVSSGDFVIDQDRWICKLYELTAIARHPLNSDRLHYSLKRFSMSDRDSFWQSHVLNFGDNDIYESALPIKRLIDWSWTKDISANIDFETARLTAQSLSWLLSSTNLELRDKTTKAMVNLLENQAEVLIAILKAFRRTNDMYIIERLYAVAYGCVLRTKKKDSIRTIAKYVYSTIFKKGSPPKNVLLRDYARNICEYAIYLDKGLKFDAHLLSPPYRSDIPDFPSKKDISKFKFAYSPETEKIPFWREHNSIYNSVIDGDFGVKIINTVLHEFSPFQIRIDEEIKEFVRSLTKQEKTLYRAISLNSEFIHSLKNLNQSTLELLYENVEKLKEEIKKFEKFEKRLLDKLKAEPRKWIQDIALPHLQVKFDMKDSKQLFFASAPVKYWIVKRAFELGYKKDLHGEYDSQTGSYNNRHDNHVERIGKKYQWIAYYEILAVIADNFEMQRGWGSNKINLYKGAWQLYLRNIDPAYTTKDLPDEEFEDELGINPKTKEWWSDPSYLHWNIPSKKWVKELKDMPPMKDILLKKEANGTQWVHLQHYISWNEPKKIGQDKYFSPNKRIRLEIQAYLIKKQDKRKVLSYLADKNLMNIEMPVNREAFGRLINREKFWSPAYFDEEQIVEWDYVLNADFKVIVATTAAKGSMENDRSEANSTYNIPCQTLFEGLNLEYSSYDGDFTNAREELIVTNINPGGVLVRKDKLEQFLAEKNLEIFWTVVGEKISDLGDHKYDFGVPTGIFYIEKGDLKGEIKMYKRE